MTTMDAGNGGALKLTDEMQREANAIYDEHVRPGSSVMGAWSAIEAGILAGYRMGQRDMRERAAKACYRGTDCAIPDCERCEEAKFLARCIRLLPIEDANG